MSLEEKGFMEFSGRRTYGEKEPMVSITKKGYINVNKKAYNDYLSQFQFVQLYYYPEKKIIALKPTNTKARGTRRITVKQTKTAQIAGYSFFRYFEIKLEKKKLKAMWNSEMEALLVLLE